MTSYPLNDIIQRGLSNPRAADLLEAPKVQDDEARERPLSSNLVDEICVCAEELLVGDIVACVVGSEVDDREIRWRMGVEVPIGWVCSIISKCNTNQKSILDD